MESNLTDIKVSRKAWHSLDDSLQLSCDKSNSLCLPTQEELGLLLRRHQSDRDFRLSEINQLLQRDISLIVEAYYCEQQQPKECNFSHPILSTWMEWYLRSIENKRFTQQQHVDWKSLCLRDALLILQSHWFDDSQITEDDLSLYASYLKLSESDLIVRTSKSSWNGYELKVNATSECHIPLHASANCFVLSVTWGGSLVLLKADTMARVLIFAKQFFQQHRRLHLHIRNKLMEEKSNLNALSDIQSLLCDKYKPDESASGAVLYFEEVEKAKLLLKRKCEQRVSDSTFE
jgi:hypothetical protein